jgi:hypothetical protein
MSRSSSTPIFTGIATVALLSAALPNAAAQAPAPSGVALINPGFEAPAERRPKGWILTQHAGAKAYKMEHDSDIRSEGKQSFRVTRFTEQVFGSVAQFVNLPKGHKIKALELSAMLRSDGTEEGGWKLVANVNGSLGILEQYNSEPLVGTQDWRRVTVKVPITPDTTDVKVGAVLYGAGTGWVDDVSLKVIE